MRERNVLRIQLGYASLDILTFGSQRSSPRRGKPTVPEIMRGTLTSSGSDSMHTSTFAILLELFEMQLYCITSINTNSMISCREIDCFQFCVGSHVGRIDTGS